MMGRSDHNSEIYIPPTFYHGSNSQLDFSDAPHSKERCAHRR
jgi:hypothetical protein